MKKAFAIIMVAIIAFTVGFTVGKGNVQSQSSVWIDSTGEVYYQK